MKKTLSILLIFTAGFISFSSAKDNAQQNSKMNIATYNIRVQTSADTLARDWEKRKTDVAKLIKQYNFDIFGVQEVANAKQETDLRTLLPSYTYFGKGRDSQMGTAGEQIGIFYKTKRFTIKDYGFFFLSATPEAMSLGWDAAFRRMCVWTKLYDKNSEQSFYVFCTHFDHLGVQARVESAKLIVNKINEIAGDFPVLFVGDLNTSPQSSDMYKILSSDLKDSREVTQTPPTGSIGTFNGFDVSVSSLPLSARIDYIFCKKFSVFNYKVLNDRYSSKTYPSDHFPVMVVCEINLKQTNKPSDLKSVPTK